MFVRENYLIFGKWDGKNPMVSYWSALLVENTARGPKISHKWPLPLGDKTAAHYN